MFKYSFRNINISFKKFKFFSYNLFKNSYYIFELLIYLNYLNNKSSLFLKKIFFYILNDLKLNKKLDVFEVKINNFIINKGCNYKRLNFRCKGKLEFFVKHFCNIFFFINF